MRKIGMALLLLWPGIAGAQSSQGSTCGSGLAMIKHEASLDADFDTAGRLFRIDPDLGRAIAIEESRFVVNAVSSKGAMGLMQLMPATSQMMGVRDPFDSHQNIYGGMKYLRVLADDAHFSGNPYMILVAYGAGPNHTTFPQEAYRAADLMIATYWQLKAHREHGLRDTHAYFHVPPCGHHEAAPIVQVRFGRDGKVLPTRHYLNG